MTLGKIKESTENDRELLLLKEAIKTGSFKNECKKYEKFKSDFSEHKEIILRSNRIVIPKNLQKIALNIVHESHHGLVKTKQFLRTSVYWYGMDSNVEKSIKNCLPGQAVTKPKKAPSNILSKLPQNSWIDISIDFYGPLENGNKLLVIIDNFSRFLFVETMKVTTAKGVGNRLNELFTTFGYLTSVRSDNGPPFKSKRLKLYFKSHGINHKRITLLWPRRNGIIESFMKTLGKTFRTALIQRKHWRNALDEMLITYRNTPHSTTNQIPSLLFLNRRLRTKLPCNSW